MDTTVPFTLSEDHLAFQQSVRTLARSRYADSMLARSQSEKFPTAEFGELGAAGLLGLLISESAGGQGGDVLAVGIAVEELAYADPAIAYLAFAANVSNALLAAHGSDEVRERWVTRGIAGEAVICLALTEPGAGSDAANLSTRATRVDGGWRISGEKTSITQAVHADVAIVIAQTEPGSGGKGIGMFLVDMDDPAVTTQAIRDPGFKPLGRGSIFLDGVFVPDSHVLGEIGRGFAHGDARIRFEPNTDRSDEHRHRTTRARHGDRILQTASDIRPAAGGQPGRVVRDRRTQHLRFGGTGAGLSRPRTSDGGAAAHE